MPAKIQLPTTKPFEANLPNGNAVNHGAGFDTAVFTRR
jgi:hypothetical protein